MKVAIAGWSGLVGAELLKLLVESEAIEEIHAFGRREGEVAAKKLHYHIVNFERLSNHLNGLDAAFCCLGTTIKKAGSQEAFKKVDLSYVLAFAEYCHNRGAKQFHVISAAGVSESSSIFYNKVKAQMEKALKNIGFESLVIYRPSLLLGERNEFRLGERIGAVLMNLLAPLLVGKAKRFKAVHARQVANAMLAGVEKKQSRIVENETILEHPIHGYYPISQG